MFKISCEITNLLKDGRATIAEATLSVDGKSFCTRTGKSICNPKDDIDSDSGVKIATARAKTKCYKQLYKAVDTLETTLLDMAKDVKGDLAKIEERMDECADTIDENAYPEELDDLDDSDEDPTPDGQKSTQPDPERTTVSAPVNTDSDEKDE
jgi:hypothetical protein